LTKQFQCEYIFSSKRRFDPKNKKVQKIQYIIVHCSATPPEHDVTAREVDSWHKARGFRKIGYHFLIRRNGSIETGRMLNETGAHTKGYNTISIGICLAGGIDSAKKPDANYSRQQWSSLQNLVQTLTLIYPEVKVRGHRDMPDVSKACPCFDATAWWNKTAGANCHD
jgi:N-acetylmuramoyl-L-alanine amidase